MSLGDYPPYALVTFDAAGRPLRHYRVELGDPFYGALIAFADRQDAEERLRSDRAAGGVLPTSLTG